MMDFRKFFRGGEPAPIPSFFHIEPACANAEEAALLRAALTDFSPSGPREFYAAWLEQHGEPERAETVRRTVQAYHDMDFSTLNGIAGDPAWLRMLGATALRVILGQVSLGPGKDLTEFRDAVFANLRPALAIEDRELPGVPELGEGCLFGDADLPEGIAWPKTAELDSGDIAYLGIPRDLHALFGGQIDFADLKGTVFGCDCPPSGGFQLFLVTEFDNLGIVETVLRDWDPTAELVRTERPHDALLNTPGFEDNYLTGPRGIVLKEVLSLPNRMDMMFEPGMFERAGAPDWRDLFEDVELVIGARDRRYGLGGHLTSNTAWRIGDDDSLLRLAALPVSVDVGIVHFAISADALKRGDLSQARYVWNDWDG